MSFMPIFPLQGAFAAVGDDDTAFSMRRTRQYLVDVVALSPDPAVCATDRTWARSIWDTLRPLADNYPLGVNNTYPQSRLERDEMAWVRLNTSYRKGSDAYLEFATRHAVAASTRGVSTWLPACPSSARPYRMTSYPVSKRPIAIARR